MTITFLSSTSRDRFFRIRALALGFGLMSMANACDKAPAPGSVDSTQVVSIPDSASNRVEPAVGSGWDANAGLFVILPTVEGGMLAGSLLRADATEHTVGDMKAVAGILAEGQVELFSRLGLVGVARVTAEATTGVEAGCSAWPVARLTLESGQPSVPWTAAFSKGRISAIALDSIEGFSPRDSARLAIELTRLASRLQDDTVATFRGLPFVVLRGWRSRGLAMDFVVATLARRVNQEDSPQEERLVVVVDVRDVDAKKWTVAWHERASGREDELVVAEPLLAFQTLAKPAAGTTFTGPSAVHLLFGRDDGVALGAATLVRDETGWHVQWESAIAGCN